MTWENVQIVVVLFLVCCVFVTFLRERFSPDIVAGAGVGVLLLTGILTANEALSVFSNSGPLTVACMFILSAALERTGCIEFMGQLVCRISGRSPAFGITGLMLVVMIVSAFINNTPVVVILTPVVIALSHNLSVAPSRLLIPLSYASIFGGTCTLIGTSTNLLVDGIVRDHHLAPFGMFEITVPGLVMGFVGLLYMFFIGRYLLPDRQTLTDLLSAGPERRFLAEVLVPHQSSFIGKTIDEAGLKKTSRKLLIDVLREDLSLRRDMEHVKIRAGDRLVFETSESEILGLRKNGGVDLDFQGTRDLEPVSTRSTVIVEGIVSPQSRFSGRRIADCNLRRRYGVYVLAVHRHNQNIRENFDRLRLTFGDTLLLEGPADGIRRLFDEQALMRLSEPQEKPFRRSKAPIAIIAILSVMVLAALDVMPIVSLAIIAAAAVMMLGCLDAEEAYKAIEWRLIVLIFGMLAISLSMEKTGAVELIAGQILRITQSFGPLVILAAFYAMTSLLTEIVSNNAVAVLLTPVAIGVADQVGIDPRPLIVAVMFGASASFATPIGYQTNTFVYSAGGYRFADFLKVGVPLNFLLWLTAVILIPFFWPF